MSGVAFWFFLAAIFYGLLGLALGLQMAISEDHGPMPVHAHIMVIGWLSFAIFGFFYIQFADTVARFASLVHAWSSQVSLVGLIAGLWLVYTGNDAFVPLAAGASVVYALSFCVFAYVAFPVLIKLHKARG